MFKRVSSILLTSLCAITATAQQYNNLPVDKIIGVVGSKSIVLSDLTNYYGQLKIDNDTITDYTKCDILLDMVAQKVLNEQAFRDSVVVSDEEVNYELDDRINSFIAQFGSKEQMEARLGKSVFQIKEENREEIKEQLTARNMKQSISSRVVVTPDEIRSFYKNLGVDKMPYINASVELGQIIINPKASQEIEDYTKEQLEDIRKQIVDNNKDFSLMAGIYSQDPGSKNTGGLLESKKEQLDPAFASNVFRLKEGEISPVFRSSFGYHIAQLIKRTGNTAKFKHILLIPEVTTSDLELAIKQLDSVKKELESGKLTYATAIEKFSNDDDSKNRMGMMFDFRTGNTQLTLDQLDPQTASLIQDLKVGDYTSAHVFANYFKRNAKAVRIIYLKNRIDPHQANLEQDYTLFQNLAKEKKIGETLQKFVIEKSKTMYVKVDPMFDFCEKLQPYIKK